MKNTAVKLSKAGLQRLPRYYRCLRSLIGEDILRVNSDELAAQMGLSAAVVRQDFRCLGGMGQQGYGYNVKDLYTRLGEILGVSSNFSMIFVCGSDEDAAFAENPLFLRRGIRLHAVFAIHATQKSGCGALPLYPFAQMEDYCRVHHPRIAVLSVPSRVAQTVAAKLEGMGIDAIWNLSGARLQLEHTIVRDFNPMDSLLELTYLLRFAEETSSQVPDERTPHS